MSALVCPCPPCSFAINVPANDVVSIALYLNICIQVSILMRSDNMEEIWSEQRSGVCEMKWSLRGAGRRTVCERSSTSRQTSESTEDGRYRRIRFSGCWWKNTKEGIKNQGFSAAANTTGHKWVPASSLQEHLSCLAQCIDSSTCWTCCESKSGAHTKLTAINDSSQRHLGELFW